MSAHGEAHLVALIDECLPQAFGDFLAARGWTVYVVGKLVPFGTPDRSVVAAALDANAVVVTSDSDFRQLRRSAHGHAGRLEAADRIFFKKCTHPVALEGSKP